jgi:hypothetical protein
LGASVVFALVGACAPNSQTQHAPASRHPLQGEVAESDKATVADVEFQAVTDAVWTLPAPGKKVPMRLELRITNRSGSPLRFHLFDTLMVRLRSADGRDLHCEAARDATSRGKEWSPPVAAQATFVLPVPAELERRPDGTLRLSGPDGFGGEWWFDGLRPGRYALRIAYGNDRPRTDAGEPLWAGRVETSAVAVEIK